MLDVLGDSFGGDAENSVMIFVPFGAKFAVMRRNKLWSYHKSIV